MLERQYCVQVGHQVRLLILFDGSTASRQPSLLEIGPRARGDAEDADWAESEGLALVLVLDVLATELAPSTGGQAIAAHVRTADRSSSTSRRKRADRPSVGSSRNEPRRKPSRCWAASTAATTWYSESFSPVRLEKWAPLFRNSISGALPVKADAAHQVVDLVAVKSARGRGHDVVLPPLDQLGGLDGLGLGASAWSSGMNSK